MTPLRTYRVLRPFVHLLAPWKDGRPLACEPGQVVELSPEYAARLMPGVVEEVAPRGGKWARVVLAEDVLAGDAVSGAGVPLTPD